MKNPWQVYRRAGQTIDKNNRLISDWARRHINDKYVRQSLKDGYRCRSAYKLLQIQEKYNLLEPGKGTIYPSLRLVPSGNIFCGFK